MESGTHGPGLLTSARALGATLLDILGTRAELALLELREEGERRKAILALLVVAILFFALGLLLVALFVVVLFWDTHRLAAVAAMTLLYLAVAATAFTRVVARVRASPPPFEATLRELAADREALRGSHD